MEDFEKLIERLRQKYKSLEDDSCEEREFLDHMLNLSRYNEEPMDYPEIEDVDFPETISIAYAVCHPFCGIREFIVDGSTQECCYCGGQMFRAIAAEYRFVRKYTK